MDWKEAERAATTAIREGLLILECQNLVLVLAKKCIKKLGGKTAEEEAAII